MMQPMVRTQQLAQAVGVSEVTVKRWCDRGLIQSARTAGGHRRLPIGSVLAFLRKTGKDLVAPASIGLPECVGRDAPSVDEAASRLLQVLVAGEERRGRQILFDLYLNGVDLAVICDRVLVPALTWIGEQWKCGELAVYQERRACELCLTLLNELGNVVPPCTPDAPIAIGCTARGDPYTLPTSMIQLSLSETGWRASSVGRGLSFACMASAVETIRPQLFWLSVSTIEDVEAFIAGYESFYEFTRNKSVAVVLGGQSLDETLRRCLRFTAFGDNLKHLQEFASSLSCYRDVYSQER